MKATLLYSLARLGVFAGAVALLLLTPLPIWASVIIAALAAFLISYIFFGRLRNEVALAIVKRREAPERDEDADLEDSLLDAAGGPEVAQQPVVNSGPYAAGIMRKAPADAPAAPPRAASRRPGPPPEDD